MCSPKVMAATQASLSRRGFLSRAGALAGGAAAGLAGLSIPERAAAQNATPVASPATGPAAGQLMSAVAEARFSRVQDLTHVTSPEFPVFPGYNPIAITPIYTVAADGFFVNELTLAEHTGIHMDAPAHFIAGAATAEQLAPERLFAPLVIVDISARAATDPDAQLMPDDLVAWEAENGPIPAGAVVAKYSGWEARLTDPATFLNADADGTLHFPGFHPDAAAFLVAEREIVGVGVDTISIDFGPSQDYGTHVTILGADKYGLENLAALGTLPPIGSTIVVGGPKHLNASGGPTRAFALL